MSTVPQVNTHKPTLILLILWSILNAARGEVTFNADVRPIFQKKCFTCHGPDQKARKADLRLDIRDTALEVITPGNPAASALLDRIRELDPEEVMPPPETHKKITAEEADILHRWIAEGAHYQLHWAFVAPKDQAVPSMLDTVSPIDAFVHDRLLREGLNASEEADRRTLIRRLSIDLTGLPPTPDQVGKFLDDSAPDAYQRLVEHLLASPHYGEHMAATWLETSRYADTDGYQNDRYRYHWAWRDWVVQAFNRNLPYDQFVVDQLAGDMLPNATLGQQIATGFCRNHRINSEAGSIPEEWQAEYVADRVDTLGTVFLGVTLGCARCHDHKYDPITQKEYYQLFAYFNNISEFGTGPNNGNSPPFIPVPKAWPRVPEHTASIEPGVMQWQKNKQYGGGVRRPKPGDDSTLMVMQEMAEPRTTYVLRRGLYNQPDTTEALMPAVPAMLKIGGAEVSTDRVGLSNWLVHPEHPLTARVAVNRYWQHFFGNGLVRTSENLGVQGELPSHPQLLDWLAREFITSGWNVKAMHKRIVMSGTYRQCSDTTPAMLARDPENRLLARAPRLRLPAFAIRDQALVASGLMVHRLYGRPAKPYMPAKIWSAISNNTYQQDKGANLYRRSLYTYWRRTIPPPTMMTFNAGDREICTVRQSRTNTPLQALTLLNNVAFVEAARTLAVSMLEAGGIDCGLERVIGRPGSVQQRERLQADLALYLAHYRDNPSAAKALIVTGESAVDSPFDPAELAAMTLIASTILNLDESLTRE